jgi:hypothetical protein
MRTVVSLITGQPFLFGAMFGLIGAAVALLLRRWKPDWGAIWAVAVIFAAFAAGVARFRVIDQRVGGRNWVYLLAAIAAAAAAFGIVRMKNPFLASWAVALSLAGIWATVPDTEVIAVQLGVTAVLMWVWHPAGWAAPRVIGAVLFAALAAWAIVVGGIARTTGVIGGFGALTSLGWSALMLPTSRPWIWLGTHAVSVILWSRWAGLTSRAPSAIIIGVLIASSVAAVGYLVRRQDGLSGQALAET